MHWLKTVHVGCVALSFAGFCLRGVLMMRASPLLRRRLVSILPHVVDTVLLVSAIGMLWQWRLSPLDQPWLVMKIAALLVYIGLGMIALRLGSTRTVRSVAWGLALGVYLFIVSVAVSKSPWGLFADQAGVGVAQSQAAHLHEYAYGESRISD